jgi:hypothetical protein
MMCRSSPTDPLAPQYEKRPSKEYTIAFDAAFSIGAVACSPLGRLLRQIVAADIIAEPQGNTGRVTARFHLSSL